MTLLATVFGIVVLSGVILVGVVSLILNIRDGLRDLKAARRRKMPWPKTWFSVTPSQWGSTSNFDSMYEPW